MAVQCLGAGFNGTAIATWVSQQRRFAVDDALQADRAVRLGELPGWTWDPDAAAFQLAISRLRSFAAQEGTARALARYRTPDGFPLGKWCVKQRLAHRRGQLPRDRMALLEQLPGWSWEPRGRRPRRQHPGSR